MACNSKAMRGNFSLSSGHHSEQPGGKNKTKTKTKNNEKKKKKTTNQPNKQNPRKKKAIVIMLQTFRQVNMFKMFSKFSFFFSMTEMTIKTQYSFNCPLSDLVNSTMF